MRIVMECNGRMVPYWMARSLITKAMTTATDIVVYVKGHEKREWLRDLLLDEASCLCGKYRGGLRRHRISK